jgi:hypothetical protein
LVDDCWKGVFLETVVIFFCSFLEEWDLAKNDLVFFTQGFGMRVLSFSSSSSSSWFLSMCSVGVFFSPCWHHRTSRKWKWQKCGDACWWSFFLGPCVDSAFVYVTVYVLRWFIAWFVCFSCRVLNTEPVFRVLKLGLNILFDVCESVACWRMRLCVRSVCLRCIADGFVLSLCWLCEILHVSGACICLSCP